MTKLLVIVGVVIMFLGIYLAFGNKFFSDPAKYTGPVEKVVLAAYPDYAAPVYIAKEKGFFKEVGLDVDIKTFEAGRLAMNALLKDEADIATAADFVFASDSFDRNDIKIFSTVTLSNDTHELVARRDRGIANIADIKGKKVGVTKKSSGEYYLGNFLIKNNIKLTDIELVDLQPSEIVLAVGKGDIDVALAWEPNVFKIKESLGQNIISFPAQGGQDLHFLLISKQGYIDEKPEVLERFLRAMVKTEEFVKANPVGVEEFAIEKFHYEPEYIKLAWHKFNVLVKLPQELLLAMEDQARWRIANKLTDKTEIPNYLDYIYTDALKQVKPEAVTIIK